MRTTIDPLAAARGRGAAAARGGSRSIRRRRSRRSSSTTATAKSWPMSATPIFCRCPARHDRHGAGDPLAGLGAEAVHLRDGVRPADHPSGNPARRPAPTFRRLRTGDFDGRFLGEVTARRGAAIFAERAGGRGARPARARPVHRRARRRRDQTAAAATRRRAWACGRAGRRRDQPFDLATLYVALSHDGAVAPLRYPLRRPAGAGTAIFGPVAAWYVNDILAEAPPPPGMLPAEMRRGRHLAFKTGTSYGFRDAWAVGYDPEVTIARLGRAARRHADAGPQRADDRRAGAVQDRRSAGPAGRHDRPKPPPPGALLVGRRDLPPRLQRLDPGPLSAPAATGRAQRSSIRRTARRSNGMARRCRSKRAAEAAAALARRRQAAAAGRAAPRDLLASRTASALPGSP